MSIQLISRQEHEQSICERFLETVEGRNARNQLRSALRNLFMEYSTLFPGESVLSRTRDTLWIPTWRQAHSRMGPDTWTGRLSALKRIMRFQYACGKSDTDIFELMRFPYSELKIRFPSTDFSLQRESESWLDGVAGLGDQIKQRYRARVLKFTVFSGHAPGPWPTQEMVEDWVKFLSRLGRQSIWDHVHSLELFLGHLHHKQLIPADPLGRLRRQYPTRGLRGIIEALGKPDPTKELPSLQSQQFFRGPLAQAMRDYLDLKRATGRIYDYEFSILLHLDRFLADRSEDLNAALFNEWVASLDHLHSTTQSHYYSQGRQFCEYLKRSNPHGFVPGQEFCPAVRPPRVPVVLSKEEVARLFESVAQLPPGRRSPLRRQSFHLMLTLLYCCGLRLGEVLRLDLEDVNLVQGVLTIRNTKFFKSRLVPLDPSVRGFIAEYLEVRKTAGHSTARNAPLFCSSLDRRYFKNSVRSGLRRLMESTGIRTDQRRVRVHDLRHTFAVHRLTQWYLDGDNVQAKLPVLSQYMGHVDIAYTHHYLSLVPDLCGAAMQRFQAYATPLRRVDHEA